MRSPQWNMLAVLDALDGEPLTLRELARRTELPLATVHRVVTKLVEWGGLERVAGGVRPGLRLFELGQLVPQRAALREVALPFMGDLYAATHEVVSLAVLDGTDTVWVEQLSGRLAPPVPSRIGGRLPAHVTAAGKALLAFHPAAADALCAAGLPRHGPGTITDPAALRAELDQIRERGIATQPRGVARRSARRGRAGPRPRGCRGRRARARGRPPLALVPGGDGARRAHRRPRARACARHSSRGARLKGVATRRELTLEDGRTLVVLRQRRRRSRAAVASRVAADRRAARAAARSGRRAWDPAASGYARPSYGGSSPDPGRDVAKAAGDVAQLADALGLESLRVMGASGGGPHALACAALLPGRVTGAVTLASPVAVQRGLRLVRRDGRPGRPARRPRRAARRGRSTRGTRPSTPTASSPPTGPRSRPTGKSLGAGRDAGRPGRAGRR